MHRGNRDIEKPLTINTLLGSKDNGTFGEIRRRIRRSFCRLVVTALRSGLATELEAEIQTTAQDLPKKDPIIMNWRGSYDLKFARSEFMNEGVFDL